MLVLDREENVVRLGTVKYLSTFGLVVTQGYVMPEFMSRFVLPPAQAAAEAQITVPAQAVDPIKVPRPRNAFIIYRVNKHFDVLSTNPGLHNNQICKGT